MIEITGELIPLVFRLDGVTQIFISEEGWRELVMKAWYARLGGEG